MGAVSTGYRVVPSALDRAATELTGGADQLHSARSALAGTPLPGGAFGWLPESGQASQAHGSSLAQSTTELDSAVGGTRRLATGVTATVANYRHHDALVAQLFARLSSQDTEDPLVS